MAMCDAAREACLTLAAVDGTASGIDFGTMPLPASPRWSNATDASSQAASDAPLDVLTTFFGGKVRTDGTITL
jgi:hypothetical protein